MWLDFDEMLMDMKEKEAFVDMLKEYDVDMTQKTAYRMHDLPNMKSLGPGGPAYKKLDVSKIKRVTPSFRISVD